MNYYQKFILEVTGCDVADIDAIEDSMRNANNGILGNLSHEGLAREAIVSFEALKMIRSFRVGALD